MATGVQRPVIAVRHARTVSSTALQHPLDRLRESTSELAYVIKQYVPTDFMVEQQRANAYRRSMRVAVDRVNRDLEDFEGQCAEMTAHETRY